MTDFLKEGHYLHLVVDAAEQGYWQVVQKEAFNYETGRSDTAEFTTVAVGAASDYKNIGVLEPDQTPAHLFQVRMGVLDGFHYYVKIPTGTDRLGVDADKNVGFIDNEKSPAYEPDESYEFWLIHNYYPSINAKSEYPHYASGVPKVFFSGMKYAIKEVKDATILTALKNFEAGLPGGILVRRCNIGGLVAS